MTEAVKSLVYKLTDTFQVGIANLDGIDSSAPVELMRSITGVVSASLNGQQCCEIKYFNSIKCTHFSSSYFLTFV